MIQIIDYQNGLIGIRNIDAYSTIQLKINSAKFDLGRTELTLSEIPTEIFQRYTIPRKITHYIADDGISSIDDYNTCIRHLKSFGTIDDDNFIWETRQDKENYDKFVSTWKPVFSEETEEWRPVQFEVVKKQMIPDRYKGWIESSIIIETDSLNRVCKAICTYTSNPTKMIHDVAFDLGFSIVSDENNTAGKKLFVYDRVRDSVLKYSKVNDGYFKIPEDVQRQYKNKTGTLEECIAKFDWEWKQIRDYLRGISNVIDNKSVNSNERAELIELLDKSISHYRSTESMKSSRDSYRSLGNVLNELRRKLTLLDQGQ